MFAIYVETTFCTKIYSVVRNKLLIHTVTIFSNELASCYLLSFSSKCSCVWSAMSNCPTTVSFLPQRATDVTFESLGCLRGCCLPHLHLVAQRWTRVSPTRPSSTFLVYLFFELYLAFVVVSLTFVLSTSSLSSSLS